MTPALISLSLIVIALCLVVLKMYFSGKKDKDDNPGNDDKDRLGV